MEQCGSSDHAGENAFHSVHADMRIDVRHWAIGEDQPDIQPDQWAAPSKNETHEPADVAVFLDAIAIVDPDEREVLHVVENFEQRNANKNVCHEVVAVPPKRDARDQ